MNGRRLCSNAAWQSCASWMIRAALVGPLTYLGGVMESTGEYARAYLAGLFKKAPSV